jgi:predicted protein tyrosine phosphatase
MTRLLFVCSRNRLRSPTAEHVFAGLPGIETASAGLDHDADVPLSPELLAWADRIFVMENRHRDKIERRFREHVRGKRVVCLAIPDDYLYMEDALVRLLEKKMRPYLQAAADARPDLE